MSSRKKRRGSSSKKYSWHVEGWKVGMWPDRFNFTDQSFNIGGDQRFLSGVGVEVAVGAAMFAEWDVEVNRCVRDHVRGVRFLGKPISKAMGPSKSSHMAVPRPKRSARMPMSKGSNFASGSVTAPIAMMLAL